jgi:hypothetical protein
MNTLFRRILLIFAAVLGFYAGIWAEFLPRQFYSAFPGFGLHWIDVDGAYNEHLIRDVGSFYIALAIVSVVAIVSRSALPGRIAGLGWAVFGVLHFGYHLVHLTGSTLDIIGNVVSLAVSAALGIILAMPTRTPERE